MMEFEKQIGRWCTYFNGVHHEACRAGIAYKDVQLDGRLPCLKDDGGVTLCPFMTFPTEQEAATHAQKEKETATHALRLLGSGFCPHCHAKIEREQQVGRSVYAVPCGHRLYQGRARKKLE